MTETLRPRLQRLRHILRNPRVRKVGQWVAVLWLVFVALGYFVAPPLARSVLLGQLSQSLGREVSIDKIAINPLTLTLDVHGLSVKKPAGGEQFGFEQLHVNLSSFSIAQAGIVVDELRLQAPRASVTRLAEGRYDISDLLDSWLEGKKKDTGSTSLPRFSLNNIQISDGRFDFDDQPKGVHHTAESVRFELPFISSLPYKADVFVRPVFSARVDGSEFSLQGRSKPFADSHASELDLHLEHLDLSRLRPYLPTGLPVRLKAGTLSGSLKAGFAKLPEEVNTLNLSGQAQLLGLEMTEVSGTPFLGADKLELGLQKADPLKGLWNLEQLQLHGLRVDPGPKRDALPGQAPLRVERLSIEQASMDLQARRMEFAQVHVLAAQARIVRTPHGELSWIALPQTTPSATPAAATAAPSDWAVRVGQLTLEEFGLRLDDHTFTPVAVQQIEHGRLNVENLDIAPGQKSGFTLSAAVNRTGTFQASGSLQWRPLAVHLNLETQALPVASMQAYVDPYLNASMVQGQLSSKGELDLQQQGTLQARYKGMLALGRFRAVDKANNADFLKWKSLYIGAVDFQLAPMGLRIGEIALSDFYSRLILNKEGRLNLTDIIRQPEDPSAPAETKKPSGAPSPMPLQIAKVTLQNGQVDFSDHFVRPNYSANISKLGGSIQNLSSAPGTLAELDLRGSYARNAPVHISARLNPLADRKFLDLQADISSIDLVGLSPYAGKYAGYNIDKGKLSLNASYKLQDRQLTADNRLFIDQLTFGERVDSPDATQLPVHLAIALLKNNRGEIDINLPISGSLDDPHFSIGGLIFKVIANLFVKAVTSPFALLGAMFGDNQELSQIGFAPGLARLDETALRKLEALAKAMREREGLTLEITGRADRDADQEGLRRAALERAMQAEKRKDVAHKPRDRSATPDSTIASSEYATYLARAYQQARFPKPRNLLGLPKELPVQEMEKLMLANQIADDDALHALATQRAQAAQTWLVEQGLVPLSRIFLLPAKIESASGGASNASPSRVDFSLR
ncbi:MAG: DUF748 domain-containing protein [Limnohabitans sp.]